MNIKKVCKRIESVKPKQERKPPIPYTRIEKPETWYDRKRTKSSDRLAFRAYL